MTRRERFFEIETFLIVLTRECESNERVTAFEGQIALGRSLDGMQTLITLLIYAY